MQTADPDFVQDMNAVLKHIDCKWLNGTPPDYTLSNKLYNEERPEFYSASRVPDPHQSHQIFRTALGAGFGWECLETYSQPPLIVFKWRLWGRVTGEVKCPMRNGQTKTVSNVGNKVEIFGISKVLVNDRFQIMEIENFFRPDQVMEQSIKGCD